MPFASDWWSWWWFRGVKIFCGAGLSKIEDKKLAYPIHAQVSNGYLE
jgi:hypothetical protein